jgi:hypothetical protein
MAVNYNARTVTTGLLLDLDAATSASLGAINRNAIVSPENFANTSVWGQLSVTITPNVTTAPDGTVTADLAVNTGTVTSLFYQLPPTANIGTTAMNCSVYAKAATSTTFTFNGYYTGDTEVNITFTLTGSGSTNDSANSTITALDNGWYRCSINVPARVGAGTTFNWRIWPTTRGSSSAVGCYFWGAQLEIGTTATTYYPVGASTQPSNVWNNLQDTSTIIPPLTQVRVLLVGGGGGGGYAIGGGGGGGGVIDMPAVSISPGNAYAMIVGAGGAQNTTGSSSTAFGATAAGGGGSAPYSTGQGKNGGSGGGSSGTDTGQMNYGGQATGSSLGSNSGTIYGNPGGSTPFLRTAGPTGAAGGGGAGGRALDRNSNSVATFKGQFGNGGPGIASDITGTTLYYGGGGGGGAYYNGYAGDGGIGGGGAGSCTVGIGLATGGGSALNPGGDGTPCPVDGLAPGGNGGANTGGGGGGGAWNLGLGGTGGSGVIIVRYPLPVRATGGTITIVGNDVVHTFTSGTSNFTVDYSTPLMTLYNPSYYLFSPYNRGAVRFNRSSGAPKDGAGAFVTGTGPLTSSNFLYNDHTWEVWFRIDDVTPGGYDATEVYSILADYIGYHAGFQYTATVMYYYIWNGASLPTCATWTVGTSGAQINQGSWYQIAVTKSGNVFTPYINGAPLGTGSTTVLSATGNPTSNNICLGKAGNYVAGAGSYDYFAKNTIGAMHMYNRALTANEIVDNFNALRGRYGI